MTREETAQTRSGEVGDAGRGAEASGTGLYYSLLHDYIILYHINLHLGLINPLH